MTTFNLAKDGYVLNYLTTEAVTSTFKVPHTDKNQLKFEADMRKLYNKSCSEIPHMGTLGEKSALDAEWRFYAKNRNPYIDFSKFYYYLTDVKIHAITQLVSKNRRKVKARMWSYARVNMWVNSIHVANIDEPVYKPINHKDFEIQLEEGINDVFIKIENFGVRDTRNMFSLQIKDTDGILVTLPAEDDVLLKLKEAEEWLCSVTSDSQKLIASSNPPADVTVTADGDKFKWKEGSEFDVSGKRIINVEFEICGQRFERIFDLIQNVKDSLTDVETTMKDREMKNLSYIGNLPAMSALYVLAHYAASGTVDAGDYNRMDVELEEVKSRTDCADFGLSALLIAYKKLPISEDYKNKIKSAALDFRYWMDQKGADAMCFWSENHALLFYVCQMAAGILWPNEYFHRSGLDGKGQYAEGYRRVCEWFDVIEHDGFEEFLAGGYLLVTMAALMTVHIFGDGKLKERAKKLADRIVYDACIQCFDGIYLAPMGRIYREALTPYDTGIQALLHIIDGKCKEKNDVWLGFVGVSNYEIPTDAKELIYKDTEISFNTGRAWVTTKKTKGYMLTSVASPRKELIDEFPNKDTEYYKTLVMNEWFHGTSDFVPGEYGYQQHLWYAAISNKCYIFVNHSGTEKDFGHMRPDYWFGNGIFPAVMQEQSTLYTYFEIPDEHPTKFTHAYWPSFAMDEEVTDGNYRFARVGDSYMALWCSNEIRINNSDAVMDCDLRAYGDTCAWVVKVGMKDEFGSMDNFIGNFKSLNLSKEMVKDKFSN